MQKESKYAKGTHILESAREGQVRTRSESKQWGRSHQLEGSNGGTSEDSEGGKASKGVLTDWRAQTEGYIRTGKEC
jgi:hypothetical protein